MVAADFEGKTANAFDGVLLGVAWRAHEKLSFGAGYVFRLGEELSPGFKKAAATFVAADPMLNSRFQAACQKGTCGGDRERDKALDGFPLAVGDDRDDRVFVGDPIIPSTNKSLFFGVFIPLDVGGAVSVTVEKTVGVP